MRESDNPFQLEFNLLDIDGGTSWTGYAPPRTQARRSSPYTPVFRTRSGSTYLRDDATGLWLRRKPTGLLTGGKVYVGCVDGEEFGVTADGRYRLLGFSLLDIPGFNPTFQVGYQPIAIGCLPKDIADITLTGIVLKQNEHITKWHLGSPIKEVYRD